MKKIITVLQKALRAYVFPSSSVAHVRKQFELHNTIYTTGVDLA
jgi:hypothetical protein